MAMHPRFNSSQAEVLFDLILKHTRSEAISSLCARGLITPTNLGRWIRLLPAGDRDISDLLTSLKLRIDRDVAEDSLISTKNAETVVLNMLWLGRFHSANAFTHLKLEDKVALDFGSGVFYPLSAAILLLVNGYQKVWSLEPFPLHVDFVVANVFELVQRIMQNPGRFNFSGISNLQLKQRLANLDLDKLHERLSAFNSSQAYCVDLGGVTLIRNLEGIPKQSVDNIFSNSVMEHLQDFSESMVKLRQIIKADGVGLHTVDFADHRYYHNPKLSLFEMYFDGVLFEINGIRPREMEKSFSDAGFHVAKHRKLAVPKENLFNDPRMPLPTFDVHADDTLLEWVNGYVLTPI